MRKLIYISGLFILCAATVSEAQFRFGPYLAYGEGLNLWGVGATTEFVISERVSVSPSFAQYFPENFDNNPRRSAWELNGNVNYYVVTGDIGYLYGLAGLNYTNIKTRISLPGDAQTDNDGNLGFNFGIGTMVNVDDLFYPFAEGKYTAGGFSQVSLVVGVKFQLGDRRFDYDY